MGKERIDNMNVVFLDVDGVLNNDDTYWHGVLATSGYAGVEDKYLSILRDLVNTYDLSIVLSSDWRLDDESDPQLFISHYQNYLYLITKLSDYGLTVFDKTPVINYRRRGREIHEWLESHDDVDQYVILDDTKFGDFYYYKDVGKHVILTDGIDTCETMLSWSGSDEFAKQVIKFLNKYWRR